MEQIINTIEQKLEEAEHYYTQGQLEQAEAAFREVLALEADSEQALQSLVVICLRGERPDEAQKILQLLLEKCPDNPMYCDRLASVCEMTGDIEPAANAYRTLLQLQPDLVTSRFNLARYLRSSGALDEALLEYQACLEAGIDNAEEVYTNIGSIHTAQNHNDLARESLEQALQINPDYQPALFNLGLYWEEMGNWEKAHRRFKHLFNQNQNDVDAMLHLADGQEFTDPINPLVRRMLRTLRRDNLAAEDIEKLHYGLGKIYDDCRQYDDAMAHYSQANRESREAAVGAGYQPKLHKAVVDALVEQSPAWAAQIEPVSDAAPIFICGMFRSGTTLLEQILAAHPGLSAGGEIDFFRREIGALPGDFPLNMQTIGSSQWGDLGQRYLDEIERLGAVNSITNKRPDNFLYLSLIKAIYPNARILHIHRNPVDTCLSIFFQPLQAQLPYANDISFIAHYLVQYRRLMNAWQQHFGENICHLSYEALVAEPEATMQPVLEFLNLDWDDACLRFYEVDNRVRTASVHQVRKPFYQSSSGRAANYASHLNELRQYLSDHLPAFDFQA